MSSGVRLLAVLGMCACVQEHSLLQRLCALKLLLLCGLSRWDVPVS